MAAKAREIPAFFEEHQLYREQNPAFDPHREGGLDPRAKREIDWLFATYPGPENAAAENPDYVRQMNEAARRVEMFRISIGAKVSQMMGNELWREKQGSSTEEFRAAPRTMLKTIQEVLTHPTERLVFDRKWLANPENEKMAIESIIIEPRRISNTLLHNLGLDQFIPEKGLSQEAQLEMRAKAIPFIKQMLRNLESIYDSNLNGLGVRASMQPRAREAQYYFRLMRIGDGPYQGELIGTQRIESRKRIFKTDLQGAYRRLLHVEAGYEAEVAKLMHILAILNEVRDNLDDWDYVKKYPEELTRIQGELATCVESLKFVRDQDKQRMLAKITECLTVKDASGAHKDKRFNPGAVQAKIVGIRGPGTLGKRLHRITRIAGFLGEDKLRMQELLQSQRAPLFRFKQQVEQLHEQLRLLDPSKAISEDERARIIHNLNALKALTMNQTYQPQLSFAEKFIEKIDEVKTAIEHQDQQKASKEFLKMYLITKLEQAYTELQQTYREVSTQADKVDPAKLRADFRVMYNKLRQHMVAGEVQIKKDTPEDKTYYDAYVTVYRLFDRLDAHFKVSEGEEFDTKKLFAAIKREIDAVDFAPLAKNLDKVSTGSTT